MTAILILNIVFAAFVVGGIVSLLGWAIATDRHATFGRLLWARNTARVATTASTRRRRESALDLGA